MVLSEAFGRGALGEWLPAEANARLIAAAPDLHVALTGLLDRYLSLANSGDAGFWNPEEESEVISARAALSLSGASHV